MSRPYVPLTVEPAVAGSRTVLAVTGEVDIATAPHLRAAVDAAFMDGADDVCVDLTDTTFMDSSGVHALVDASREAVRLGRELTIVCPPGPVARVIEIAGVEELLTRIT